MRRAAERGGRNDIGGIMPIGVDKLRRKDVRFARRRRPAARFQNESFQARVMTIERTGEPGWARADDADVKLRVEGAGG